MDTYQAGVCNIGGAEVARRRQVAIIGGVIYLALALYAVIQNFSPSASLVLFAPASIFAIGFVQSRKRFCLAYGLMGTFNFQKLGSISKVGDKAALAADRKMAIRIVVQSLGIAFILTALVIFVNSF
ncbi:MAG: hypothetical protein F2555_00815 [Actinobacteria bacterium]|uniref:Unannotated protein n=1 Tax=freshwater metagenome TaxID=449393 RepID=A0A6J6DD03_9ZZZZ|nr:hypothetical protein [Actinomycetota bacterium]